MDKELKPMIMQYVKRISGNKNVIGAAYLDRPNMDKDDDIDIVVFVKGKPHIRRGEHIFKSHDFDVSVEDYSYARKAVWGQETRASFKYANILFDKKGRIKKLIKSKMRFTNKESKNIIISNIFNLIWLGIYDRHKWIDYRISYYPHDLWIRRNDLETAHLVLDFGIDLLLNILYAYNKEFIPSMKWKLHNSFSLKWIPKNYKKRIDMLLKTEKISKNNFERRYKIIKELLEDIIDVAEKERILPRKMYHYFLNHDRFYSLHPEL